jgi:ubiquinone/menaquinone biosynthesis C-methylase UbiE
VNLIHNMICSSRRWRRHAQRELVPWGIESLDLGTRVLELGPGFGATTRALVNRLGRLDVVELDRRYCEQLQLQLGSRVNVTCADATALPYGDGQFTAVLCFTMLHHVPSAQLQDKVFSEVARVLAAGGVFAGTDSVGTSTRFKLIHIGDTLVPIDPDELPDRLRAAGLTQPEVDCQDGSFRFRARKASSA